MECELQIDWHRHDPPGTILSPNGDIDNRLKTLFDALRMPQNETEIPSDASHDGMFFCLLEDDSLITKLSVSSRRLRYSPADILGEHTVEATSDRVEGTRAHRDELWDQCYESLMQHARSRMEQEVARLEGDYAHVLHESVDSRHDDVKGDAWLRGAFTYVLYRRAR